jgi:hypothetical protein
MGTIKITEFVAPKPLSVEPFISHAPFKEVSANKQFVVSARIVGIDSSDKLSVELRNSANKWKTISLQRKKPYDFAAEIPGDMVTPGLLEYRIIIQKSKGDFYTFPGNNKGDPYAWDYYYNDTWQTLVVSENVPLKLFDPKTDKSDLMLYNPDWKNNSIEYITADSTDELIFKATMSKPVSGHIIGWQYYFADKVNGRKNEISLHKKLVIKARTSNIQSEQIKVALILNDGSSYAVYIELNNTFQNIEIPLSDFKKDSALLLPRPYPGFLPLYFKANTDSSFNIENAEKLEVSFGYKTPQKDPGKTCSMEIGAICLKK